MLHPPFDDNILILRNHGLNLLLVIRFDTLFFPKYKAIFLQVINHIYVVALNMDMNRFMLSAVKEKRISKKSEDFRHKQLYYFTKVGIIFNTCKNKKKTTPKSNGLRSHHLEVISRFLW